MRVIPKTAKIHPAAKKCCGWKKPAICAKKHLEELENSELGEEELRDRYVGKSRRNAYKRG